MYCKKCGAEIKDGSKFCIKCGVRVAKEDPKTESVCQMPVQPEIVSDAEGQVVVTGEPLTGKKYTFVSANGANLLGTRFNARITSNVEIAEDRLFIDIKPKRFNKSPAILFEDIIGIDISRRVSIGFCIFTIIAVICGVTISPYYFLSTAIFVWCGLHRKITILQRNGKKVVMYDKSESQAKEFKEDMKKVARIR